MVKEKEGYDENGMKYPFKDKSIGLHDGVHRPMYERFNLSKNIENNGGGDVISVQSIKIFIKILRDKYKRLGNVPEFIEELAGDELI